MSNTYASNKWERIYYNFLNVEYSGIDKDSDHCYMVVRRWQNEYDVYIEAYFKVIV